jgi:hypothetical protein
MLGACFVWQAAAARLVLCQRLVTTSVAAAPGRTVLGVKLCTVLLRKGLRAPWVGGAWTVCGCGCYCAASHVG